MTAPGRAAKAPAPRTPPPAAAPVRRPAGPPGGALGALQRLQAQAGNAAVARLLAERRAGRPQGAATGAGDRGAARPDGAEAAARDLAVQRAEAAPAPQSAAGAASAVQRQDAGPAPASAAGADRLRALQRLEAGERLVQRLEAGERLVQRLEAGERPVPPPGLTPAQDPRFAAVSADVRAKKAALTRHPSGAAAVKAAQDAAVGPQDDREAQAKAARVAEMGTARPAGFDKAAFVAAVDKAVAAQAPKTLDEADKFAASGKADAIKGEVAGQVTAGKAASAKDVADKTAAPPDPSRAVDKPVTPLPPPAATPAPAPPDARSAAVAPAPAEQTDLSGTPRRTDTQLADAGLTPEQLGKANEPQFTEALAAKQAADAHAAIAPGGYRAAESARVAAEQTGAAALGSAGVQQMAGARAGANQQVAGGQGAAKSQDEQARAAVTAEIKASFDATKTETEKILGDLDGEVDTAFDAGQDRAKAAFTADHQARMAAYKDARYSGIEGAARWLGDLVMDLPPAANQIFTESRRLYEAEMQKVIGDIADTIGRRLAEATARIARGRDEVAAIVARQGPRLRQFAQSAAQQISADFDQLDSSVTDKSQGLVEDLAQRYTAARGELDEEIKTLQADNRGLLSKAEDAIADTARTVLQLKDMLLGVLARAAGAIDRIVTDPIGFLGHLVDAVKSGVMGFASRIGDHLKTGLKEWLFGQLAAGGIEIPEEFDAKGVIKLVLSVLGLTWARIRTRVVTAIGEPAMQALESTFEIVKILLTEGAAGLWRWIVEKLADIKETVIGAIEDFVTEKIVTAGVTWIVSLLNPASAFVRACKAIYDVVMFFVHRAAQIKSFVDSVLDSVEAIAGGGAGGVPALIENSLAKAVPVVLDFLASLLGLGGVGEKIRSILEKIQAPVMKVVDWVVAKIVAAGKAVLNKLKGKDKKDVKDAAETGAEGEPGPVHEHFTLDGQDHEIFDAPGGELVVASENPQPVSRIDQLRTLHGQYRALPATATRAERRRVIAAMIALIRADPTLVAQLTGHLGDPPNLGEIRPHRSQTARYQPPAGMASYARMWELESEHVVPRSYVDSLLAARGQSAVTPGEYGGMHTILIYKGAADLKTDSPGGDQSLLRQLAGRVRTGAQPGRVGAGDSAANALRAFTMLAEGAIRRTVAAVGGEQGTNGAARGTSSAKPDESLIRQAAAAQRADIDAILAGRPPVPAPAAAPPAADREPEPV
ncbi:hypothetical protein [Actinacidiphila epipremni]|uniref:Uncharacterized protein n=1 Tax=Actinacidiphila epipremni TaxID=2053013 RepID=A0ABX0ZU92_9ACTN|nr:hypothetical protein [Actinacidiphila epipremni]NJP46560.1 hypothetical protein [Actinacidiphila epipremni]